jgi:Asp-tRNA(Asn)/Glu-tRNA(Gln) amidotransferase A subunit family amidase
MAGSTSSPSIATNTADLNFTGHPGVSVPMGIDASGVPFGVQVVGPRFLDGLAIGLAEVIEQIQPWPLVALGYSTFGSAFLG